MDYTGITDSIPNKWCRNVMGETNPTERYVTLYLNNQTVALQNSPAS